MRHTAREGMTMSVNGLGANAPYSALRANSLRLDVSANNVANINTDEFKSSGVATSDLGYINSIGQGTQVTGTYSNTRPGPVAVSAEGGMTEQSNTDAAVEITNQMAARSAYSANTQMARTVDDMTQTLIDLKR